jgi:hypothetical protein
VAGDPQQIVVVGAGRGEGEPGAPARQRFAGGTARPAPSLLAGVPNHERGCTNGPRDRSVPRLASSSAKPRYRQPKRPVILLGGGPTAVVLGAACTWVNGHCYRLAVL